MSPAWSLRNCLSCHRSGSQTFSGGCWIEGVGRQQVYFCGSGRRLRKASGKLRALQIWQYASWSWWECGIPSFLWKALNSDCGSEEFCVPFPTACCNVHHPFIWDVLWGTEHKSCPCIRPFPPRSSEFPVVLLLWRYCIDLFSSISVRSTKACFCCCLWGILHIFETYFGKKKLQTKDYLFFFFVVGCYNWPSLRRSCFPVQLRTD